MRPWLVAILSSVALLSVIPRHAVAQRVVAPRKYPELLELMLDKEPRPVPSPQQVVANPFPPLSVTPANVAPPSQGSRPIGVAAPTRSSTPPEIQLSSFSEPVQATAAQGLMAPEAEAFGNRFTAHSELHTLNVQSPIPAIPPDTPNLTPPPILQTSNVDSDLIGPPRSSMGAELAPMPDDATNIPPAPTDAGPFSTFDEAQAYPPILQDGEVYDASLMSEEGMGYEDVLYDDCPECVQDGTTYRNLFPAEICQEPDPLGRFLPFGNFGIKAGNERVLTGGGLFLPLWQSADSLVFTNLQGTVDDRDSGNGYIGLGYRTFMDPSWIFGVYVYADLMGTNQKNFFAQGQLGLELLSLNWDLRVNGYGPESTIHGTVTQNGISNGTNVTRDFSERAYSGFDFEVGHRFLNWGWNDKYEVRGYLGGYSFGEHSNTFPSFGGPRGRVEMRIYDLPWCGQQSRLELGAEVSYDRVRNEQLFGYFRVRIPLGRKENRPALDPMRRRMLDLPIHSVD